MSVTKERKLKVGGEDEIEIRLGEIIQFLKNSRWRIILGGVIGLAIGALYAFSKPNIYAAQVTVMPEIQTKGSATLGNLGALAGLAGINVDNATTADAIRPDLYPNILQSVPFALDMLKRPVYAQQFQAKMTLQEFIERMGRESMMGKLFGGSADDQNDATPQSAKTDANDLSQPIQVTKKQDKLIQEVQASASVAYDKKTGIVTISAVEPDPVVAANVARLSLDYLTNYIVTYRTQKARDQVGFLAKQVREAKGRYQSAEYALSSYRDRNRSTYLYTAKLEEQRLQADYLLEQSVYNELAKQYEQAKIKVQEETPVFKILEPPTVPLRKSAPKRTVIILGFAVVGAIISLVIVLIRLILGRANPA
jgi:uncharacterized protein involved in exopolysaccharide biosynthesis